MSHVISGRRQPTRWWSPARDEPDTARVIPLACALIAVALLYRAWASYHSYWEGDDFIFINQTFAQDGRSVHTLLTGLAGHLMPGGLYLSWLVNRVAPYDFGAATLVLTALQALASVGFLRLLLVAFGRRWGILPPLVLYLATAFTVQGTVWWGPGIHALPLQIAFFWSLASQVLYLRTRRAWHAFAAVAWVVFGLVFYEKTVLVIGALAIVTLAYFSTGNLRQRLGHVWRTYRVSVLANLGLGLVYLAAYVHFGLNFSPRGATTYPIGPTADVMILRSWGTTIFGGPLHWSHHPGSPLSIAAPRSLLVVVCWVLIILLCRELVRSRTLVLRALWLPGYFLACDVLLVVASRATAFGPITGYEFRYIEEMGAVTAVALALATMPLVGAPEQVEVKRPSAFLDHRRRVAAACVAVGLLGSWSTYGYFHNWHQDEPSKAFFTHLFTDVGHTPDGTPLVDTTVPPSILWPLSYPANTLSHLLRPLPQQLDYTDVATDQLLYLKPDGHLGQMDVTAVHHAKPTSSDDCGYRVGAAVRRIPLEGPFLFGGWWVRVRYVASGNGPLTVDAGGVTYQTNVAAGAHTLYFKAGDARFDSIGIGKIGSGVHLCTDDVTVGRASVAGSS